MSKLTNPAKKQMKTKFTIGVFGIILDDKKRVLLCHRRDYDLWNLPGGGMESSETPWGCLIREVKEETGLEVIIDELIGVYSKTQKDEIVFTFTCKIMGGKITLSDEADEIKYFSVNSMPDNTVPKQIERIHDAVNFKGDTVYKVQSGKSTLELLKEGKL